MTANYSYGGLAWDQKLRDAVTKIDSASNCPMDCSMNNR